MGLHADSCLNKQNSDSDILNPNTVYPFQAGRTFSYYRQSRRGCLYRKGSYDIALWVLLGYYISNWNMVVKQNNKRKEIATGPLTLKIHILPRQAEPYLTFRSSYLVLN